MSRNSEVTATNSVATVLQKVWYAARLAPVTIVVAGTCSTLWCMDPGARGPVFAWLIGSADTIWGGDLVPLWTSALAHISVITLAFNLYWLVRLGRPLEFALGSSRFFALLFTTAYVASASGLAFRGVGWGLSGVICGMAGFIWVSRARYPALDALIARNWSWFLLWLAFCFLNGYLHIGTANEAHLGGFIGGAAVAAASLPRWRAVGATASAMLVLVATVSVAWAPWNASWHIYQGYQALARHDLFSASKHAREARNSPEKGHALWLEAEVAWRQKNFEQAAVLFPEALELLPSFVEGPLIAGQVLLSGGDCKRAEPLLAAALTRRPKHPDTLVAMARVQECLGHASRALAYYTDTLTFSPTHGEAALLRGWLNLKVERTEEALADFELAGREQRWRENALLGQMRTELHLGHFQRALDANKARFRFKSAEPAHPAYIRDCMILFQMGKFPEALDACREADKNSMNDTQSVLQALTLLANDKRDQGLARLRTSALEPSHWRSGLWLAHFGGELGPLRAMTIPGWQREMQLFALGEMDSRTLLERSRLGATDVEVKEKQCEASTVIGALEESRDHVGDALRRYEEAVAACAGDDLYGAYARWRLLVLRDDGHPQL